MHRTIHLMRASHSHRSNRAVHARAILTLVAAAALALAGAPAATAYWSSDGAGFGTAQTAILSPPTAVTVPTTAQTDVPVSWTATTGGLDPIGYYVTRTGTAAGSAPIAACATSPATLTADTSCTDPTDAGSYTYVVTAVYNSWTRASTPSGIVTVAGNAIRFIVAPAPTIAINGGPTALSTNTTPSISGTSSALTSSPVTVSIAEQTLHTSVAPGGTWTATGGTLTAGTYPVIAEVRDATGNGSATSQALTIEVSPPRVLLGTAGSYSVLASAGVVNTGTTSLSGDLGVSPSTAISGFPPGVLAGTTHAGNLAAASAQADLLAAIVDGSSRPLHTEIIGDLGGRTFHTGVHHSTAALSITGTLTLDAQGDPAAVFIFQTDAAFNTATASTVVLANGTQAANVFWIVTGAAGTGANSSLSGSILARGAITLGASAALTGQALSLDRVTLASNSVTGATPGPVAAAPTARAPEFPEPDASEPVGSATPAPTDIPESSNDRGDGLGERAAAAPAPPAIPKAATPTPEPSSESPSPATTSPPVKP